MLPYDYFWGYAFVAAFLLAGVLFVVVAITLSRLVAPRNMAGAKSLPYESGEEPIGSAWVQLPVHYFIFALLFVVFGVVSIFLLLWASNFEMLGLTGLLTMAAFALVLVGGLAYAWRKGVLKWT